MTWLIVASVLTLLIMLLALTHAICDLLEAKTNALNAEANYTNTVNTRELLEAGNDDEA